MSKISKTAGWLRASSITSIDEGFILSSRDSNEKMPSIEITSSPSSTKNCASDDFHACSTSGKYRDMTAQIWIAIRSSRRRDKHRKRGIQNPDLIHVSPLQVSSPVQHHRDRRG